MVNYILTADMRLTIDTEGEECYSFGLWLPDLKDIAMIRLVLPSIAAVVLALSFTCSAPPAFAKKGSELRDETPANGGKANDPDDRRTGRDSDDHSGRDGRHDGKGGSDESRIDRVLTQFDGAGASSGPRDGSQVRIRDGDRF
jgi:hypothetical protein